MFLVFWTLFSRFCHPMVFWLENIRKLFFAFIPKNRFLRSVLFSFLENITKQVLRFFLSIWSLIYDVLLIYFTVLFLYHMWCHVVWSSIYLVHPYRYQTKAPSWICNGKGDFTYALIGAGYAWRWAPNKMPNSWWERLGFRIFLFPLGLVFVGNFFFFFFFISRTKGFIWFFYFYLV